jgi:catechol 2,3-dioxygenase-like lactoylglutathione lyase family enzyme
MSGMSGPESVRLFAAAPVCLVGTADGQPKRNQETRDGTMQNESAVPFETDSRIHMGIGVKNLERSVAFYGTLFGRGPTKTRPRYAKFEVAEPPVNLALNEVGGDTGPNNPVAHFGIQVKSTAAVEAVASRLRVAGLETAAEENVTCCYAVQNKVWATDPDGNKWEVYVVLDDDAARHPSTQSACCADESDCCEDKAACCTALPDSDGTLKTNERSSACACSV